MDYIKHNITWNRQKSFVYILLLVISHLSMSAQRPSFVYPSIPDSLRQVEQRTDYLATHYWDHFDFKDTLQLNNPNIAEQGFVNFIDLLPRLLQKCAQRSVHIFTKQAFQSDVAKAKFESLIDHYLGNPQSPMRNDRTYLLFLQEMKQSSCFDETEKERISFQIKTHDKNLPGDSAIDFSFSDKDGKSHHLSDYKDRKVIIYFYDPDCDNCHRVSAWLAKQTIPATYTFLPVYATNEIRECYSLMAMPSLYLLNKDNQVILKDCSPEMLMQVISK